MTTFRVWDATNSTEAGAWDIEAYDSEDAAREYADQDSDGQGDGSYTRGNQPIMSLERDGHLISVRHPDGSLSHWRVGIIEYEPVWGAHRA